MYGGGGHGQTDSSSELEGRGGGGTELRDQSPHSASGMGCVRDGWVRWVRGGWGEGEGTGVTGWVRGEWGG